MFKDIVLSFVHSDAFQNSFYAAIVLSPCFVLVAFIYRLIKLSKEHRKEKDK